MGYEVGVKLQNVDLSICVKKVYGEERCLSRSDAMNRKAVTVYET